MQIFETILQQAASRLNCDIDDDLLWYAWPQAGSTAGPTGVGGQIVRFSQVLAFAAPGGKKIKWCSGQWRSWDGIFQGKW